MVHPAFFDKGRNLAMLIDAENAPTTVLGRMLERVSLYGVPMIRYAYGDWTKLSNKSVNAYKKHGIRLIQQTTYVSGKNASDIRLVIDAMDILHMGNMQGFCIVSSDSDFTGLCNRIREAGLFIMGIGQGNITHDALQQACHLFIPIEDLMQEHEKDNRLLRLLEAPKSQDAEIHLLPASNPVADLRQTQLNDTLQQLLERAYVLTKSEYASWINLATLGNMIQRIQPNFDCKTYGYSKLSTLIKNYPQLMNIRKIDDTGTGYEVYLLYPDNSERDNDLYQLLSQAFNNCLSENDWVNLGNLGHYLQQIQPDFDCKMYGYSKLSTLIRQQPYMDIKPINGHAGNGYHVRYITE